MPKHWRLQTKRSYVLNKKGLLVGSVQFHIQQGKSQDSRKGPQYYMQDNKGIRDFGTLK